MGLIISARKLDSTRRFGDLVSDEGQLESCDTSRDTLLLWLDQSRDRFEVTWVPKGSEMVNDDITVRFV